MAMRALVYHPARSGVPYAGEPASSTIPILEIISKRELTVPQAQHPSFTGTQQNPVSCC
jgi:hypothetical protein